MSLSRPFDIFLALSHGSSGGTEGRLAGLCHVVPFRDQHVERLGRALCIAPGVSSTWTLAAVSWWSAVEAHCRGADSNGFMCLVVSVSWAFMAYILWMIYSKRFTTFLDWVETSVRKTIRVFPKDDTWSFGDDVFRWYGHIMILYIYILEVSSNSNSLA